MKTKTITKNNSIAVTFFGQAGFIFRLPDGDLLLQSIFICLTAVTDILDLNG